METDFYVHALPGRTMGGSVERVRPTAELRDHDNVFIAEVIVNDRYNVLRPGMGGQATVYSDAHTLGWNLFHKAYYALAHLSGW